LHLVDSEVGVEDPLGEDDVGVGVGIGGVEGVEGDADVVGRAAGKRIGGKVWPAPGEQGLRVAEGVGLNRSPGAAGADDPVHADQAVLAAGRSRGNELLLVGQDELVLADASREIRQDQAGGHAVVAVEGDGGGPGEGCRRDARNRSRRIGDIQSAGGDAQIEGAVLARAGSEAGLRGEYHGDLGEARAGAVIEHHRIRNTGAVEDVVGGFEYETLASACR